jgi:hypothetical protein
LLLKKYISSETELKPNELKTPSIQGNMVFTKDKSPNNFLGYWSDGLWINTYDGNDVPRATQLLFSKTNDSIGIRKTPNYKSDAWEEIYEILSTKSKPFLGSLGISKITYIQDEGTKTLGNGYVDKTTGKLYRCVNTTTDTAVTTNFELSTNIDNSSRLALIEERLGIYSPVGKIQSISVSRNEDSSSPALTYSSV